MVAAPIVTVDRTTIARRLRSSEPTLANCATIKIAAKKMTQKDSIPSAPMAQTIITMLYDSSPCHEGLAVILGVVGTLLDLIER
jgi:hypothetical protein